MTTATTEPQAFYGKIQRGGVTTWIHRRDQPPIERPSYDPAAGVTICLIQHRGPEDITAPIVRDPHGEFAALMHGTHPTPFDWRMPNPLHDQLETAERAGFKDLADALRLAVKIKPRSDVRLLFNPGPVHCWHGIRMIPIGPEDTRIYLRRHLTGDHGSIGSIHDITLTPDMLDRLPFLGVLFENKALIETSGTEALVHSRYPSRFVEGRGVEEVRISTLIGKGSIVWSSR